MRGKRIESANVPPYDRITPAGAGKTLLKRIEKAGRTYHPRRCGENQISGTILNSCVGSPPQVRGKPAWSWAQTALRRITPAGAGKTRFRPPTEARDRDHPRRCGENDDSDDMIKRKVGSPPQVRGKRVAGRAKRHDTEDHPRRCGENFCVFMCPPYVYGSPPQVRGKLEYEVALETGVRITPAGAGKTGFAGLC